MIRVRLFFDSLSPNSGSHSSLPVKKCWMMLNLSTCKVVKDLEDVIRRRFFEKGGVKLSLSIDDFSLPSEEVIEVIRENDIIKVEVIDSKQAAASDDPEQRIGIGSTENEESSDNVRKKKKKKKDKEVVADETENQAKKIVKSPKHKKLKHSTVSEAGTSKDVDEDNKESDSGVDKRTDTKKKKKKKKLKKSEELHEEDHQRTNDVSEPSLKKKDKKKKAKETSTTTGESSFVHPKEGSAAKKTKSSQHAEKDNNKSTDHAPVRTKKDTKDREAKKKGGTSSTSANTGLALPLQKTTSTTNAAKSVERNRKGKTAPTPVGQRLLKISQTSHLNLNTQQPSGKSKGHIRFSSDESSSDTDDSSSSESSTSSDEEVVKKPTQKPSTSTNARTPLNQKESPSAQTAAPSLVNGQLGTSSNLNHVSNALSNHVDNNGSLQSDAHSSSNKSGTTVNGSTDGGSSKDKRSEPGTFLRRSPQQSGRGRKRRIGQVQNPFSKMAQLNTQLSNKSVVIQNPSGEPDKPADPSTDLDTPNTAAGPPHGRDSEAPFIGPEKPPPDSDGETPILEPEKPPPEPKDYTPFPPLVGPPRAGDKIAYKILELTNMYCPEVSDYKEAEVMTYHPDSQTIMAKLSTEHLPKPNRHGRFEMHFDDENAGKKKQYEANNMVSIQLTSLIEPKLL